MFSTPHRGSTPAGGWNARLRGQRTKRYGPGCIARGRSSHPRPASLHAPGSGRRSCVAPWASGPVGRSESYLCLRSYGCSWALLSHTGRGSCPHGAWLFRTRGTALVRGKQVVYSQAFSLRRFRAMRACSSHVRMRSLYRLFRFVRMMSRLASELPSHRRQR